MRHAAAGSRNRSGHGPSTFFMAAILLGQIAVPAPLAGLAGGLPSAGPPVGTGGGAPAAPGVGQGSGDPSQAWLDQVQEDVARREYELSWRPAPAALEGVDAAWQAPNRSQGFRTYFTEAGIRLVPRGEGQTAWTWGLTLAKYGRGATTWEVPGAALSPSGAEITYRRGSLEERYENTSRGLKQWFELAAAPEEAARWSGAAAGNRAVDPSAPIHLDLALWGDLSPRLSEDGQSVEFVTAAGESALRYVELVVTDVRGTVLPSWMEGFSAPGGARGIRLVVDDSAATYPITIDPLVLGGTWVVEGNFTNARLGISVATAGDVNGDGYSDIIAGAQTFDGGLFGEGIAYVYMGSPSGPPATPAWSARGGQQLAQMGFSVSTAGDVNGDGYADVLVGANQYTNGQSWEGRAYLYLGSAAGLAVTPTWFAESNQVEAFFGAVVATAGDVNNDGYSDVLVAAPLYDNGQSDEGRVHLYLGSATGLSGAPAWTVESNQAFAYMGTSAGTAGDVNGDGYSDVIVGAPNFSNDQSQEGIAYVYLGSAAGLAAAPSWTAEGNQAFSMFGVSVSTAGDVNGDGYADVVVGATLYDDIAYTNQGRVSLYLGSTTGLSTSRAWTAEGNQANAGFGNSVAPAGDVNGDGYGDVIIGCEDCRVSLSQEGVVWLYLGSPGGLPRFASWSVAGGQAGARLGGMVATAGDVNGDGYSDLIFGARNFDNGQTDEGRVYVYIGTSSGPSTTADWTVEGDQAAAGFGTVASAGDVNGDGYDDVIIGSPGYDSSFVNEGRAFVYHGSPSGLAISPAWVRDGGQAEGRFGFSVAAAGDVNGDGYGDVVVGAEKYDGTYENEGRVFVYHGSASGLSTAPAWTAQGGGAFASLGYSVAMAGDVNGDGYADLIVGAIGYGWGLGVYGAAFIYHGSAAGLSPSPAAGLNGGPMTQTFGRSVSSAGDVNGDGFADVIVGDPQYSAIEEFAGAAWVFHGSASGVLQDAAWVATSNRKHQFFGTDVSTTGDVNGDGYADVIIGGPVLGAFGIGRAFVYHGSASGLSGIPAWEVNGPYGDAKGGAVAAAGDVNGDGYADVLVGAPFRDNGTIESGGRVDLYLGSPAGLGPFPSWFAEHDQAQALLGYTLSTAGDVNGDGYADIIVCAPNFDNTLTNQGKIYIHYGNAALGLSVRPQQMRPDGSVPIAPEGTSYAPGSFLARALGRTPFGRGRVRIQVETKPLGTSFNGVGIQQGSVFLDTGTAGVALSRLVAGLDPGVYHWRARMVHDKVKTPWLPASRWFTMPRNGWEEADLRLQAFLGGIVWDDQDGDGVRGTGEPGVGGVVVSLLDGGGAVIGQRTTQADGSYSFGLPAGGSFRLEFQPPGGYALTLQGQGGDPTRDSDPDPATGLTVLIGPFFAFADSTQWGAGMIPGGSPPLPIQIQGLNLIPGSTDIQFNLADPNPGSSVTGYNVYRASQPAPPPAPWTLLGANVVDEDPTTAGIQWTDPTGESPPPGGVFYFQVTAYNAASGTEGPR